jgi:hypothetical protein
MAETVLSLLQELITQVTALEAAVTAAATDAAQAVEAVRQLASDTQLVVLHVQDTLGQAQE